MVEQNISAQEQVRGWLATLTARSVFGFSLFFAFIVGCLVVGAGLHDPDTCWLLAMGKYISEHGTIPSIDPFSYTFSALAPDGQVLLNLLNGGGSGGRVFIPYQWLTELVFYFSYKLAAGYGLLIVTSTVIVTAFLALPLVYFRMLRSSMLPGFLFVILGVVVASFHFLARPEIFSYLFFAILFFLLVHTRLRIEKNRRLRKQDLMRLLPLCALMLVWVNMHTGFTSAFIYLGVFALIMSLEALCRPRLRRSIVMMPWIIFFVLLLVSFLNPFGTGLWSYIPELFFSPINKYIQELSRLTATHLKQWTFYPYFILALSAFLVQIKCLRKWMRAGKYPLGFLFSLIMPVGVFIAGICCLRLIPFVALAIVFEMGWLMKGHCRPASGPGKDVVTGANLALLKLVNKRGFAFMLVLFAWLGALIIWTRVGSPPTIPQAGDAFHAPFKSIKELANGLPEGRLLNHPQFGDMLIWYLIANEKPLLISDPIPTLAVKEKPKVFIDTRFDMYGAPLVGDYHKMENLFEGGFETFQSYHFDWVYLPPKCPLAKRLLKDPQWRVLILDEESIVLVRAQN